MNSMWGRTLLIEIAKHKYEANPWEKDFMKSIMEQLNRGNSISEKQAGILRTIYQKATNYHGSE